MHTGFTPLPGKLMFVRMAEREKWNHTALTQVTPLPHHTLNNHIIPRSFRFASPFRISLFFPCFPAHRNGSVLFIDFQIAPDKRAILKPLLYSIRLPIPNAALSALLENKKRQKIKVDKLRPPCYNA